MEMLSVVTGVRPSHFQLFLSLWKMSWGYDGDCTESVNSPG